MNEAIIIWVVIATILGGLIGWAISAFKNRESQSFRRAMGDPDFLLEQLKKQGDGRIISEGYEVKIEVRDNELGRRQLYIEKGPKVPVPLPKPEKPEKKVKKGEKGNKVKDQK